MKIVFCWTDISGYMAACWRALAARGHDVHVVAYARAAGTVAPFDLNLMAGVSHRLLSESERHGPRVVLDHVRSQKPDVLVLCGWVNPAYVNLASSSELRSVPILITMDTPWRGELRQRLAKFKLGKYLKRASGVFVAGERGWQYARYLGFAERNIYRGVYGLDFQHFAKAYDARLATEGGWPRKFLYVGRYESVKGIDVLLNAYSTYRSRVSDPWSLTCCGSGPLASTIRATAGVTDAGFVQPADQPTLFAAHGAFVMPSTYEPWGVAIAEACSAGLPVVCTEACNAGLDLVRSFFNGRVVETGNTELLARGLEWMHRSYEELPEQGQRSRELAAAYDATIWARRWESACMDMRNAVAQ